MIREYRVIKRYLHDLPEYSVELTERYNAQSPPRLLTGLGNLLTTEGIDDRAVDALALAMRKHHADVMRAFDRPVLVFRPQRLEEVGK